MGSKASPRRQGGGRSSGKHIAPVVKPAGPESDSEKSGPSPEPGEAEQKYGRALEAALKREIRLRRQAENALRKQFKALAASLRSVLKRPEPQDFFRDLLHAAVRECDCVWATALHVRDRAEGSKELVSEFRSEAERRQVERAAAAGEVELDGVASLYCALAETHRCTLVLKSDDARLRPALRRLFREMKIHVVLITPFLLNGGVRGWAAAYFTAPDGRIQADWVAFFETAASQVVLVLQLAELAAAERRRMLAEERGRIARDMHDLLAQAFSGIMLQIEAMRAESPEPAPGLQERIAKVRFLATQGLEEVRRALTLSRPALLDQHSFSDALRELAREISWVHGVPIEFSDGLNGKRLDSKVEVHLFAIASEAISNAVQHAHATEICLTLRCSRGMSRLEVRDNGRGFVERQPGGPAVGHFGLRNMRERAEAIGATLEIKARPRSGTVLVVSW